MSPIERGSRRPVVGYVYGFGKMPPSDPGAVSPSNLLWGAIELERLGYVIKSFYPSLRKGWLERSRFLAYLWFLVTHRRALSSCDVLYVYTQKMIFAAAVARSIGLLKSEVMLLLGSIDVGMRRGGRNACWFRWADRWALGKAAITLYYTSAEADAARRNTGLDETKIAWMRFAVDAEFYTPSLAKKGNYVIAIGNDHRRDWRMVAEVAESLPGLAFKIVSQNPEVRVRSFPDNVELCCNLSVAGSKSLVEEAKCLLLATKPHLGFSGTTTVMNALLLGTQVVLDEACSLGDYGLKDGVNCLVFRRGEAQSASHCIQRIFTEEGLAGRLRAGGLSLRDTFSMTTYAKTLAMRIDRIASRAALDRVDGPPEPAREAASL